MQQKNLENMFVLRHGSSLVKIGSQIVSNYLAEGHTVFREAGPVEFHSSPEISS